MIVECKICGAEFEAAKEGKSYCPDCCLLHSLQQPRRHKKNDPNEKIYEAVRKATKLGLSYGKYMGGTYPKGERR